MDKDIDLKLARKKELGNLYDISFANGDFEMVNNFDTSLQMSIYCERRADPSEVPTPELRRGWWGNELSDNMGFQIGSKIWLLAQARLTQDTLNKVITYTQEALEWYVEDGLLMKIEVSAEFLEDIGIRLFIKLYRSPNQVETKFFDLWNNTESYEERSL